MMGTTIQLSGKGGSKMEHIKTTADVASGGTILASLFGYLPEISAAFALVYTIIRIFETRTIKGIISRFRRKRPPL